METAWVQALSFFKSRWYLLLASVIACLFAVVIYSWFTTSIHNVTAIFIVDTKRYSKAEVNTFSELLKSKLPVIKNSSNQTIISVSDKSGEFKISATSSDPQFIKRQIAILRTEGNKIPQRTGTLLALSDSIAALKQQVLLLQNRANQVKLDANKPKVVKLNNPRADKYRKHLAIFNYILSYLNKPVYNFVIIPEGFSLLEADIIAVINDFNKLQYKRQELLTPNQPDLPLLKRINQEIQLVRQQLYQKIQKEENTITAYTKTGELANPTLTVNSEQEITYRRVLEGINKRRQLALHKIDVLISQERKQTVDLAKHPLIKNADITDTPNISITADGIILTVITGLLIPFFIFFINNHFTFRPQILTIKEIKKLPTVVELYKNHKPGDPGFLTGIGTITRQLLLERITPDSKVITVSRVDTDADISSFCFNLAGIFSKSGKKVVLVDGNLQEPSLLEQLKISYTKGLKGYFEENTEALKSHQRDSLIKYCASRPGIALIGAGPVSKTQQDDILGFMNILNESQDQTEAPTDISAEKWDILIKSLEAKFSMIILQLPDIDQMAKSVIPYPDGGENLYLVKNGDSLLVKRFSKKRTKSA